MVLAEQWRFLKLLCAELLEKWTKKFSFTCCLISLRHKNIELMAKLAKDNGLGKKCHFIKQIKWTEKLL